MEHKRKERNHMHNRDRGRLLTASKAAIDYGIKTSSFYHWYRYKKFKIIKLDKKVLFWESDFLQFLDENTVPRDGGENSKWIESKEIPTRGMK